MASDRKRSQKCCFDIIAEFLPFCDRFAIIEKLNIRQKHKSKGLKEIPGLNNQSNVQSSEGMETASCSY